MSSTALIAGGGIGGLGAALALSRAGWSVTLLEQAQSFGEFGAGIQMGPNVVRVLRDWGLMPDVQALAAFPQRLQIRHAVSGAELGVLRLGEHMVQRYGAPYATIHRADLHQILLKHVLAPGDVTLQLQTRVAELTEQGDGVQLTTQAGETLRADMLIGADGLWSVVRRQLLGDTPPRVTGHLAYRALVRQDSLPAALRSQQVTAWLGPKLHVVQYPVRGGEWLNVVAIIHGTAPSDLQNWDHSGNAADLQAALTGTCAPLRDLIAAISAWRLWALCDRPPMRGAHEHAKGRVALLGDAAHPMRPYLAQGAGMALEDAAELARLFKGVPHTASGDHVVQTMQAYAQARWARNARVQARSIRNGEIFHLQGPARFGRDAALRLLGERLLDVPWLYGGPSA